LLSLIRNRSRRIVEHEAIWAPVRARRADGLTNFQAECEKRLLAAAAARSLAVEGRVVAGTNDPYVTGRLPAIGGTFWIHADGAQVECPNEELRLEDWDVKDPAELYDQVQTFISKAPALDVA
jgi:hypothetical protein